jgi:hypothetical protein
MHLLLLLHLVVVVLLPENFAGERMKAELMPCERRVGRRL